MITFEMILTCVHMSCAELFLVIQSYLTLCNTTDYSAPGTSVHGIPQQEYWSGLPCPPPGDLRKPEIEPESPMSPALAGGYFTTSAT